MKANEELFKIKNDYDKTKKWNNIEYAHFLFSCLPLNIMKGLKDLKIDIRFIDPSNEWFVVGIFLHIYKKLGYKQITMLKSSFPDAEVITNKGEVKKLEFEYNSREFQKHIKQYKNSPFRDNLKITDWCHIIVCWNNNLNLKKYPELEESMEIWQLKDLGNPDSPLYKKLIE